jgi:hypothetical protein
MQTIGVHYGVHLAGESAAQAAHLLFSVPGNAGSVLVHNGCIDHLHGRIVGSCLGFP